MEETTATHSIKNAHTPKIYKYILFGEINNALFSLFAC